MYKPLIPAPRSIIPALDLPTADDFRRVMFNIGDTDGIGAYKLPGALALTCSLWTLVREVGNWSGCPVIFDYQKAGTDIPDTAGAFVRALNEARVRAAILFPMTGPVTQRAWTQACMDAGIRVIIGGEMTHPQYLASEGGYIADDAPRRIYDLAIEMGVCDFVIPGNKVDRVRYYTDMFDRALGVDGYACYSPGLVTQGGGPSETGRVAGKRWHAIVGRGIIAATNPGATARTMCDALLAGA